MKKIFLRVLSTVLFLAILCSLAVPAAALPVPIRELIGTYYYDECTYKVYSEPNYIVIEEYAFNVLMARTSINVNDPEVIQKEDFSGRTRSAVVSTMNLSDYAVIGGRNPYTPEDDIILGNITYYGLVPNINGYEYEYYGVQCSYHKTLSGSTSFTINKDVRDAHDFATIFIAAMIDIFIYILDLPTFGGLSIGKGVAILAIEHFIPAMYSNWIDDHFYPTIACIAEEYAMTISDRTWSTNYRVLTGGKYYLQDIRYPEYDGEVYIEGYVPDMWGDLAFAHTIHSILFPHIHQYSISNWW